MKQYARHSLWNQKSQILEKTLLVSIFHQFCSHGVSTCQDDGTGVPPHLGTYVTPPQTHSLTCADGTLSLHLLLPFDLQGSSDTPCIYFSSLFFRTVSFEFQNRSCCVCISFDFMKVKPQLIGVRISVRIHSQI